MKILITGATGFIGKNLLIYLIDKGYEDIQCIVRETSDTSFLEAKNISMTVCDVSDAGGVDRAISEGLPDVVFHCAASVMNKKEEELYNANAAGTRNICQACYKYDIARLIYLSSIAVVCGNDELPLTDEMPYKAKNAYGRSKIEAERIVVDFREKGLKAAIIRPCMVYGEDEPHATGGIFRLVESRRLPVFDVPEMDSTLQLVSVKNLVEVLYLALIKEEALDGTFIVADDDVLTVRKFLNLLYDNIGTVKPFVVPGWVVRILVVMPFLKRVLNGLLKDRLYDISRAKEILGYRPVITTEEGIIETVKYWKKKQDSRDTGSRQDKSWPDLPL